MFTMVAGKGREGNCSWQLWRQSAQGVAAFFGMATRRNPSATRQDWISVRIGGTSMDYCLGGLGADSNRFSGTPCRRGEEQRQEGRGCMIPYIVGQSNQILGVRGDSYGIRIGY
jgi:hypothetical protein